MKIKYQVVISCFILFLNINLSSAQAPEIEWKKNYGGSTEEVAYSIFQTNEGGYIFAGHTNSNNGDVTNNEEGNTDIWIVKITNLGTIEWQKTYGGTNGAFAKSIIQTQDNGYIVAGYTASNDGDVIGNQGDVDYWVLKLSNSGVMEWQKTLGGSSLEEAFGIIQTPDNGYIVAGHTSSTDGDITTNQGFYDVWLVKLDVDGNVQWQKTYGGTDADYTYSISNTKDGAFVIAGVTASNTGDVSDNNGGNDFWVVKMNIEGVIEWEKTFGGTSNENAFKVIQTVDDGYIIGGSALSEDEDLTQNQGFQDYWVVKINSVGEMQWQKSFGGNSSDVIHSITKAQDGGYILAGKTSSTNGDITANQGLIDIWLIKINDSGIIQWQKTYGGSDYDEAFSIIQTADLGFIFAGYTSSNDGDIVESNGSTDCWVVKFGAENLSVNSFSETTTISLYPNPAQDKLTIKLNYFEPSLEMNITDILGKKIHSQKLDGLSTSINTTSLKSGVYIVNIINENQIISQRFIKN